MSSDDKLTLVGLAVGNAADSLARWQRHETDYLAAGRKALDQIDAALLLLYRARLALVKSLHSDDAQISAVRLDAFLRTLVANDDLPNPGQVDPWDLQGEVPK